MGFFSWLVDDVLGFDLPDTDALSSQAAASAESSRRALDEQTTALREQTAIARQSADAALAEQKRALAVSEAALIPTIDSESARVAGENRQRKLTTNSPWGIGAQKKLGTPPVGFRVLMGL
ncbi:MAG: hypothetical protein WC670_18250 [Pseudolabrys sp.]|jgi:hypothetical protein